MTQISAVLKRRWSVVALLVTTLVAGVGYATLWPDTYVATTSVAVAFNGDEFQDPAMIGSSSTFTGVRLQSYARLATQDATLGQVVRQLALPLSGADLAQRVTVVASVESSLLTITATDSDPTRATAIADTLSGALTDAVMRLEMTPDRQMPVELIPNLSGTTAQRVPGLLDHPW